MTTENARPGKDSLSGFRGPEPAKSDEDPNPTPPVNDDDGGAPPVVTDNEPVKVSGVEPAKEDKPTEPKLTPFDQKRAEIGQRFSKVRQAEGTDSDLDFSKDENVYGKLAGKPGEEKPDDGAEGDKKPAGDGEKTPAEVKEPGDAKPEQIALVVNGKTVMKSIAEVASLSDMSVEEIKADPKRATRYAQKELATQINLEESRKLRRETPSRSPDEPGTRPASPAPNQERQEAGKDASDQPSPSSKTSNDDMAKLIEDIQIGDPKEVAPRLTALLAKVAETTATGVVQQSQGDQAQRAELNSNVQAVKGFLDEHPELEGKPIVASAIKAGLDEEYRTDLRTALINEGETEEDADSLLSKATSDQIRNAHLQRRLNRNPHVRQIDKALMEKVYERVRADFGAPAIVPKPAQALDRGQRKEALPQQPRRASVPPATPAAAAQPISRKAAVAEMATRTGRKPSSLAR